MKKIIPFLITLLFLNACNNKQGNSDTQKVQADSLFKEVMDGHNVAMAKEAKINDLQTAVQKALDSVSKLPAKAQQALAPYKSKLQETDLLLKDAWAGMTKWMEDFKYDSAENNLEQRIKYLTDEKLKVGKVKEAILGSLQKADSLFKAKL